MTERGRVRTWCVAAAGLALVGAAIVGLKFATEKSAKAPAGAGGSGAAVAVDAKTPVRDLARAVAKGDGLALAVLKTRLEAEAKPAEENANPTPEIALTEAEATDWVAVLAGLRTGSAHFSAYGRASAVVIASEVLHKFDVDPAPTNWSDALEPASVIFATALVDEVWEVRVAALGELKGFWNWTPRRNLLKPEVLQLLGWKASMHDAARLRLKDPQAKARIAAVACIGACPLDPGAAPALDLINDKEPGVRVQVLVSFIERPSVLSEEAILPLLYDPSPFVPPMAERVLKSRGLSPEQIGLGKLIVHPRPDMRIGAIPLLTKDRGDIDPVNWLIFLSRDVEESVRLKAIEALAGRDTPEVKRRLAEMASSDVSKAVRQAAEKILPPGESTTAALPPLPAPGAGLKLKAN
jgi:HEAT repeats